MSKPANFVKYPALNIKNLAASETSNPVKRVDGQYFDDNSLDSNNALSRRGFFGIDCVDNGSSASECRLTVQTAAGNSGLVRAGDEFIVSDGTGWWRGQAFGADDIRFSASDRIHGTDPADFSTAGFIDSLEGEVNLPAVKYIGVNEIATGNHPNAINGDDIPTSKTDSTSLSATTTALTARVAGSIEPGGTLSADAVGNATISQDTFTDEGFDPKVYGEFEEFPAGTKNPPVGVIAKGGATLEQSTDSETGNYSIEVTTSGIGQGIELIIDGGDKNIGKNLVSTAKVKLVSGSGTVRLVHYDVTGAASFGTGAAHTLTSGWTEVETTPPDTVPAGSNLQHLQLETLSGSPVFVVDAATCYQGNLEKAASPLVNLDYRPQNMLFPGGFQRWNNSTAYSPDGWEKEGSGTLGVSRQYGKAGILDACMGLDNTTANSTGIKQELGEIDAILDYLDGETVTFSVMLMGNVGVTRNLTIEIDDGDGSPATAEVDTTEYPALARRIWVTKTIDTTPAKLALKIYYSGGSTGSAGIFIGNPLLNIGSRPAPWTGENPSIWNPVSYTWEFDGTITSFPTQEAHPVFVMPADMYPLGISAYWETGAAASFPYPTLEHILRKISDGGSWADAGIQLDYLTTGAAPGDQIIAMALTDLADVQSAKIDYNEAIAMQIDQTAGFVGNPKEGTVTLWGYTIAL